MNSCLSFRSCISHNVNRLTPIELRICDKFACNTLYPALGIIK